MSDGIEYRIDRAGGYVFVRIRGRIDDRRLLEGYRRLYSDPEWRPGLHEFVDTRGARGPDLSARALRDLADLTIQHTGGTRIPFRTAVVVERDVGFGLARMYEAFSDGSGEDVRVFRDVAEALDWLALPGAPSFTELSGDGAETREPTSSAGG